MKQPIDKEMKINYDVVHEIAGHQEHRGVSLIEAAKDIFQKCKEKAMECSIKGTFITFDTIEQLEVKLAEGASNGFRIAIYDEDFGG